MKPTQEQIIAWAREAGMIGTGAAGNELERLYREAILDALPRLVALAYEAGRKDENEACVMVCRTLADEGEDEHVWARITCAVALWERFK